MRRSSILIISALSCVLFGLAAVRLNSHSSSAEAAQSPAAQSPQAAHLEPVSTTVPTVKPADIPPPQPSSSPSTALYTAKRGDTIPALARQYLKNTSYLTSSELADAIRNLNGNRSGNILKAGEQITIPGILPAAIVEKTVPVAKDFEVRAIYLTGIMAASDHGIRIIRHWREVGGNAVVFDIKDSDGSVNIPFEHPLLGKHQVYIHDLPKFVHFLHSENMHAIARIAMFRDERMVVQHPELAVQSKKTKQPWRENGKLVWTDPSNPKCRTSTSPSPNLLPSLAPMKFNSTTSVSLRKAIERRQLPLPDRARDWQRSDVITDFLKKAYAQLYPSGVLLSLDVFGVMAWQRPVDSTGQDIVGMAKYCDVLSPMIYPSHFFGMDNIEHPGDAPEHFIGESMQRFELITKASGVVVRPWLQAFRWRTKTSARIHQSTSRYC